MLSNFAFNFNSRRYNEGAPPIPPGALVQGIAAAVLSRCEMTGIPARLVAVPAPSGTGTGVGKGGGVMSAAARAGGVGPGFGGGADPAAVAHAVKLVEGATGLPFDGRFTGGFNGDGGTVVGDTMRVFI